ncbi:hypothetical protein H2248_005466 [Termitomyces sp. 'cryptogamus']|nr:hypothetical protein H2248_005466 [Termitomyces sp. 'cryptogamus']
MSLPVLVVDQAVGYATTKDSAHTFNDVQTIGGWPSHLEITKVTRITLYPGRSIVNGIEVTYKMANKEFCSCSHGNTIGTCETRELNDEEFFVGFFGAQDRDIDKPILRRIGFVIYNRATGAITTFGPFPPLPPSLMILMVTLKASVRLG